MLFNPTPRDCKQIDYIIAVDPGAKNVGLALFKYCDGFVTEYKLCEVKTVDSLHQIHRAFDKWYEQYPDMNEVYVMLVFEKPFSKLNIDTYAKTCMSVGAIISMIHDAIGYDYIACVSNNITLGKPKNDQERINNACRMFGQCGDVHGASAIGAGVTYINKHGGVFVK